jgi:hypothetical protein
MTSLLAPTTGTFTVKHIKIARNVGNAYLCPLRKFGDVDNPLASS